MNKEKISQNFINRIKDLKKRSRIKNNEELAQKMGISKSALNNYLYGKMNDTSGEKEVRLPNIEKSIELCKLFGVSLDYLFGLDDCEHPNNAYITKVTGLSNKSVEVLRQMNATRPQSHDGITIINKEYEASDNAYLNIESLNLILEDTYNSWLEKERTSERKSVPYNTPLFYLYEAIYSGNYKAIYADESEEGKIKLYPQKASEHIFLHDDKTGEYFTIQSSDMQKRICIDKITSWINEREEALKDGKH